MSTQDFVCPICERTVRAYKPAVFPPSLHSLHSKTGSAATHWWLGLGDAFPILPGYTWVRPFRHNNPEGRTCSGSMLRFYVGDATSA